MTVSAASVLAQVLPALLVAGLLGPLFLDWKLAQPERIYFASQTLSVLLAEDVLLYSVVNDEPLAAGVSVLVQSAALYSLIGVAILVLAWAKLTPTERAEAAEAKLRKRQSRATRRDSKNLPPKHLADEAPQTAGDDDAVESP